MVRWVEASKEEEAATQAGAAMLMWLAVLVWWRFARNVCRCACRMHAQVADLERTAVEAPPAKQPQWRRLHGRSGGVRWCHCEFGLGEGGSMSNSWCMWSPTLMQLEIAIALHVVYHEWDRERHRAAHRAFAITLSNALA